MRKTILKTCSGWLALLACAVLLNGCGGGGGDPGATTGTGVGTGTGTTTAAATVAVSFADAGGQAVVNQPTTTSTAPLTVKALVKDKDGKAVANALVAFSTDNTLATFAPSSGTALSNASGIASVTLRPVGLAVGGATTVKAAATVSGATVAGEANYTVGSTALTLGALGLSTSSIPAYGSTVVSVDVFAAGVKYIDQKVTVNFVSSNCTGKSTLAATALSSNGTVKVVYRDLGCGANDTITASIDGVLATSSAPLTIAVPVATSIQFASTDTSDKALVIQGAGGLLRTQTAKLTFKVFDTFNGALPGETVTFAKVPANADISLGKLSDTTDANGEVILTVTSGASPTSFRIQATLNSNGVSTLSDSVVVTTGLPVQRAFSLSVVSPNIEGLSFDSGPVTPATNVNVLLADQAGNPVPDGTPVVFQTNLGAIGSSSKGGCNTINGGCSVDFRSQKPRTAVLNSPSTPCNGSSDDSTRAGLATICASTTDGSSILSDKIGIFFSGSVAANTYLDNSGTPLTIGAVVDLGQVGKTESKVFTLQINDINGNPMPAGTKVEVTSITSASVGGVSPATVPNVFPQTSGGVAISGGNVSGSQGSYHTITIASTLAKDCTEDNLSSFNVAITTPKLLTTTTFPFKLKFKCF